MNDTTNQAAQTTNGGLNAHALVDDSAVIKGIRDWNDLKKRAMDALDRCAKAERESEFLRGQVDVLSSQKASDAREIASLRQQLDEAKVHVAACAGIFADLVEKMQIGGFRRPGSRRISAAPSPALDAALSEMQKLLAPERAAAIASDTGADDGAEKLGARYGADNRPEGWDRG
jgi:DNA topoisomerase VI subunit B